MEDKYYTPKIEEFHVGFEYEQHEIINERDPHWKMMVKKMGFSTKEINQMFYNVDLVENLDQKRIRVKYLDSNDIESLGFDQTACYGNYIEFNDNVKAYKSRSNKLLYNTNYKLLNVEYYCFDEDIRETVFIGIIKNKSELKKLLIQLEIINE